jgi:hypothetical protein
VEKQASFHLFSGEGVNEPTPDKAEWVVRHLLASGAVKDPALVPTERAPEWFRADLFQQAATLSATCPV